MTKRSETTSPEERKRWQAEANDVDGTLHAPDIAGEDLLRLIAHIDALEARNAALVAALEGEGHVDARSALGAYKGFCGVSQKQRDACPGCLALAINSADRALTESEEA